MILLEIDVQYCDFTHKTLCELLSLFKEHDKLLCF